MRFRHLFIFIALCIPVLSQAQAIDNNLTYRNFNQDRYLRIYYENDYFTATDLYYTQGVNIELVAPWIKKFPISKLLVRPRSAHLRHGLSIELNGYTPTSIGSDTILTGDRPFAACFFLKTFLIATDSERNDRFTSSLSAGIIGPGALGFEIQDGIHRNTPNARPRGWQHQIANAPLLNYQVTYERNLFHVGNALSMNAYGMARLGTISNKAALGITVMAGSFDSPFKIIAGNRKLRIYAYEHPMVHVVGYDATLQGGLFTNNSPYTIPSADVSRIVFQNRFGFVLTYKGLYLEYYQQYLTKEFNTGEEHHNGGVQVGFAL